MKRKTPPISSFFKPVGSTCNSTAEDANPPKETDITAVDVQTPDKNIESSIVVSEQARVGSTTYERDPGKRQQVWDLPIDKQVEARQFYVSEGPYQPYMREYPYNTDEPKHRRRFQFSWFKQFSWLEHSSSSNHVYWLPCLPFSKKNQLERVAQILSLLWASIGERR
jgi:hypothetical protein